MTGRYQIEEMIGLGGMGKVYRAHDRLTNTTVALKKVLALPHDLQFNSQSTHSDEHIALTQEFKILASLRHPHIISVLDYGFDEDQIPFFTMEYIDNPTAFMNMPLGTSLADNMTLIMQLLQGLQYLHQRGLIHRDLKPSNIMMHENRLKIIDFGLAIDSAQAHKTAGTLSYIAPEQFAGYGASIQSDLYAVGVLCYELILRKHPFDITQKLNAFIQDILTVPADCEALPADIQDVIRCLLAKEPNERYTSAYATIEALSKALKQNLPPETVAIRESFLQASKFVGRENELATLQSGLAAIDNKPQNFLVGGESGVGKSRLIDELSVSALVDNFVVLRGQGVAGGGLPYQLWRDLLRRLLLTIPVEDFQASVLKDIVPDIAVILEREVDNAPELTGQAYQQRLVLTITELFQKLTAPTLLILEDLQWAGPNLLPLKRLLDLSLPHLMIVATYRNDEQPDLPNELADMQVMTLARLDRNAIQILCSAMIGGVATSQEVIELVHQETEGNAFFIVETVRALAEDVGRLHDIKIAALPAKVFTGGMQQILRKRLTNISTTYQPLLELSAVIGRQIDKTLIMQMFPKLDIEDWLYQCNTASVLEIRDNTWRYTHDKLREAILADIAGDKQAKLHQMAAKSIEAVYPDNRDYAEALLEHWHQAGNIEKEIHYLLLVVGNILKLGVEYERGRKLIVRGLESLNTTDARYIEFLNLQSETLWLQGYNSRAHSVANEALKLAKQYNDDYGLARSYENLAHIQFYQGDYARAEITAHQSLTISQNWGKPLSTAIILNLLGMIYAEQGNLREAETYFQKTLVIRQSLDDIFRTSLCFNNLGRVHTRKGDYQSALSYHEKSLAIRQATGDQLGLSATFHNLGYLAFQQGQYAEAQPYYQKSLTISNNIDATRIKTQTLVALGVLGVESGNIHTVDYILEGLKLASSLSMLPIILECLSVWAKLQFQQANYTEAAELVGLVQAHSVRNYGIQAILDKFVSALSVAMGEESFQSAIEQGATLELESVVQDILTEFDNEKKN